MDNGALYDNDWFAEPSYAANTCIFSLILNLLKSKVFPLQSILFNVPEYSHSISPIKSVIVIGITV